MIRINLSDNRIAHVQFANEFAGQDLSVDKLQQLFSDSTDTIQDSRNTIKKVSINGQSTVIKSFKPPNIIQGFIYRFFRTSKAQRSFEYAANLNSLSINTPKPLGYIEIFKGFRLCESYFISGLAVYDFLIRDVMSGKTASQTQILHEFSLFTFQLHQKGVLHLDYSLGNIAITKKNNSYEFCLFDINRMKFGKVSSTIGVKNFSRLSSSPETTALFANEYAKLTDITPEKAYHELALAVKKTNDYFERKRKIKQFFLKRKRLSPSLFPWDPYSDQPYVIRDQEVRNNVNLIASLSSLKLLTTAVILPLLMPLSLFKKRVTVGQTIDSIGLCINLDNITTDRNQVDIKALRAMVADLGVNNLSIRIPLADFDHIESYYEFISAFQKYDLLVVILQDRHHINNSQLTKKRLTAIFKQLNTTVSTFQIGNAVNRKKWAFTSQDEYFAFFKIAQNIKDTHYPSINLLGGNIIDFDLPFFSRSLFHFNNIHYDGVASQLYVDRRGAPENKQFGFDTLSKINISYDLMKISPKSDNRFYITEVNWPLEGMGKWAPAQGDCMVNERLQAAYMVRYYLIMIASGKVMKCYWHQLIAPGYGLINDLDGTIVKRKAYYCFKFLIQTLDGGITKSYNENNGLYRLKVETDNALVEAIWTTGSTTQVEQGQDITAFTMSGERLPTEQQSHIHVTGDVIYLISNK